MAHPSSLSFPHKAVIRCAHAEPEFGSDCRQDHRLGATRSYEEAPHALGDGRPKQLVDHDPAIFALMLYGEDRAAWEYADRRSNSIDDST